MKVIDGDGKPVPGAKVWWCPVEGPLWEQLDKPPADPREPRTTGADGTARLPLPTRGNDGGESTHVFARDPAGRVGGLTYYPPRREEQPESVTVRLVPAVRFAGRLTDPDGTPVAGADVMAGHFYPAAEPQDFASPGFSAPPWEVKAFTARTDADGRFAVPAVPVKHWVYLVTRSAGRGTATAKLSTDKPADLTVPRAGVVRLTFAGDGTAADLKERDWTVRGGSAPLEAYADGKLDGSAELVVPNLTPGPYKVRFDGDGPFHAEPLTVTVRPGETTATAVKVARYAKLSGRVVDADTGRPLAGVGVGIRSPEPLGEGDPWSHGKTDADGRYVGYMPPGRTVTVYPDPPTDYLKPEYQRGVLPVPDVKVPADGHTFPDIRLKKGVPFAGVVREAAGKPVAATVHPAAAGPSNTAPYSLTAGADGTFSVPAQDPDDQLAPRVRLGEAVNVPAATPVAGKPVEITVAEANAFRFAGRVTDAAGRPVPGATLSLYWYFSGVGKASTWGSGRVLEKLVAGPDGRFRSSALWAGDRYHVVVTAPGFSNLETKPVTGKPGETHDADVNLSRSNLVVTGVVVDVAGRPVAGATVFQHGDGDRDTEADTDAAGQFSLRGYADGPGFALAKKDGYRPAFAPADPGGDPVRIVLRKASDPPAPAPDLTAHRAALDRLTRHYLDALWAERAKVGGFERNLFDRAARYDPAVARRWAEGSADLLARFQKLQVDRAVFDVAKEDVNRALGLLAGRKGSGAAGQLYDLARRMLPVDQEKAIRLADEAAARARSLPPPERAFQLARAGFVLARAGNPDAGKAFVTEAAKLAEPLAADNGGDGYYRGYVAADLAAFDLPAAEKLLAAFTEPDTFNRYLAQAVDRVAISDPTAARKLLDQFRVGRSNYQHEGRLYLAYRLAATDPAEAERLVEGVTETHYRVLGYAHLAKLVGRTDRPRAWGLIDKAFGQIEAARDKFDPWSGYGGNPALAALAAVAAREVVYPDVPAVVTRVLAARLARGGGYAPRGRERDESPMKLAIVLSFVDPETAKWVLAGVGSPPAGQRAVTDDRDWAFAVALVTPEAATEVLEKRIRWHVGGPGGAGNGGLTELADGLTAADRLANTSGWVSLPKPNEGWEESP